EQAFLNYIKTHIPAEGATPDDVIRAADEFGNKEWLMLVGPLKGSIIDSLITTHKPRTLVELGTYVGYSAVRFARLIANDPQAHYYSFELNPEFANIARQVIELAGLSHKVTVVEGAFEQRWRVLADEFGVGSVDFFFIDHWKDAYLPSYKLIESIPLTHTGSVIVADNVIKPGAPDYLAYVQSRPNLKTELIESEFEFSKTHEKDAVAVSVVVG
ncbi:hypothetical protein HDV00_003010, partial [Rhizophlyctis rosea]